MASHETTTRAASCTRRPSPASPGSTCAPGRSSRASSPACTRARSSATRVEFVQHREYVRRRRHPPPRLEGLVQDRPLLHQAVRGRNQPALPPRRRRQRVDALRPRAAEQVRVRLHRRRLPRLPAPAAAGLGRPDHLRRRRAPDRAAAQPADAHRRPRQGDARQPSRARRPTSRRSCAASPRASPAAA